MVLSGTGCHIVPMMFYGLNQRPENFTESPGKWWKCRWRIQVHERHELCEIGQSFHCQVPHRRSVKAKEALMHFDIRKEAAASSSMAKHLLDTLIFCVPCVYLHLLALNVSSCAECWETKLVPAPDQRSQSCKSLNRFSESHPCFVGISIAFRDNFLWLPFGFRHRRAPHRDSATAKLPCLPWKITYFNAFYHLVI